MNTDVARSSETLINIYQTARCHIPEDNVRMCYFRTEAVLCLTEGATLKMDAVGSSETHGKLLLHIIT
jgi:hypothetical protein